MSENENEIRESDEEYEVLDVGELQDRIVKIGRRGENLTQNVRIDAGAFLTALPGCTLQIAAVRPQETEVYLPSVTVADGVITWDVQASDVTKHGLGYAEVRAVLGKKVKKSALFRTRVEYGLPGPEA